MKLNAWIDVHQISSIIDIQIDLGYSDEEWTLLSEWEKYNSVRHWMEENYTIWFDYISE